MREPTSRILSIHHERLDIPLREAFGIAGGTQAVAANVLVTVTLEDGTVGLGEAAPLPAYNGETQESTLAALDGMRGAVVGMDARAWRGVARRLSEGGDARTGASEPKKGAGAPKLGAARCAVETAVLDALLRQRGMSFHAFFGGAEAGLLTDITITTGTPEQAGEAAARWAKEGFRIFKVQVGGAGATMDVERVAAVKGSAPHGEIFLDANASLGAKEAISLVEELSRRGIAIQMFEQPTPGGDWDALVEVGRHVVVAADESVVTAADALVAAKKLGAPHVINIKLMKAGVVEALDIAAVARAAGMGVMIGGNVESALAMSVSASLAAGMGGFGHVDLDTPLFLAESPFEGGMRLRGAAIELDPAAGHGVSRL
ncbi:MAG: dipeptide epimerase [Polyangiaceae bacterium]